MSFPIARHRQLYISLLTILLAVFQSLHSVGQIPDEKYVTALYNKNPVVKSSYCDNCSLWINPYFTSIANTTTHRPVVTYYVYTKSERELQEGLGLDRKGIYAKWHSAAGQPTEDQFYTGVNNSLNLGMKPGSIERGHCQAWILLAWCEDAAIFSNTYTFNCAMEYRGQNVGTEEASEDTCRILTGWKGLPVLTDQIEIWCGTAGDQVISNNGGLYSGPAYYYKILKYIRSDAHSTVIRCYLMPNNAGQTRDHLHDCVVTYETLKNTIGFDPIEVMTAYKDGH